MGASPLSRTVEVQIDVVDRSNKPPVWDQVVYGPIYVKENTAVGQTVTTVKARSVFSFHVFLGWVGRVRTIGGDGTQKKRQKKSRVTAAEPTTIPQSPTYPNPHLCV